MTTPTSSAQTEQPRTLKQHLGLNTLGDAELGRLESKCLDFLQAFQNRQEPRWLTITGFSGVGKTHAARACWRFMQARSDWSGCECCHAEIKWGRMVDKLRGGEWQDRFWDMRRWPALFIDDAIAQRDPTGFSIDRLFAALEGRERKWTIITSNCTMQEIAAIERRISDRMIRGKNIWVEVKTKSYSLRGLNG